MKAYTEVPGWDALFDCFDYDGYSLEEIMQRYYVLPEGEIVMQNQYFTMEKIHCLRKRVVKSGNWKIAVVIDGPGKGKEYYLTEDTEFLADRPLYYVHRAFER